jgi:hypothetical protein
MQVMVLFPCVASPMSSPGLADTPDVKFSIFQFSCCHCQFRASVVRDLSNALALIGRSDRVGDSVSKPARDYDFSKFMIALTFRLTPGE